MLSVTRISSEVNTKTLVKQVDFHHDNSFEHDTLGVYKFLVKKSITKTAHSSYSPDLVT